MKTEQIALFFFLNMFSYVTAMNIASLLAWLERIWFNNNLCIAKWVMNNLAHF